MPNAVKAINSDSVINLSQVSNENNMNLSGDGKQGAALESLDDESVLVERWKTTEAAASQTEKMFQKVS